MNTRLKIICILFGLAYSFIIGESIVTDLYPSFVAGWNSGGSANKDNSTDIYFHAEPVAGLWSFPTSVLNVKTGEMVSSESNNFHVRVANPLQLPLWITIANIILLIIGFFILALAVYIPIQAYKVIRSIVQNEIFDTKNVSRIRRIGYLLLIYFFYGLCWNFKSTIEARTLVHLENYKIVFTMEEEYIFLLIGFIVLLFAELLKMSHQMKVEQDFTI
jgi:hypothetical protein